MNKGIVHPAPSYIMAIPRKRSDIETPKLAYERLKLARSFKTLDIKFNGNTGHPMALIEYKGKKYGVDFFADSFELPKHFTLNHKLSEQTIKELKKANLGLTVAMVFSDNPIDGYHLQLKVLDCILPDFIALADYSIEKINNGIWAHCAARAATPPPVNYLYSISAVDKADDDPQVWLHTHGLNRCGYIELEVIDTDKQHIDTHAQILNLFASQIVSGSDMPRSLKPYELALLPDNSKLSLTWIDWKTALESYPDEDMVGGMNDRQFAHNMYNGCVYAYTSDESVSKQEYVPLTALDNDILKDAVIKVNSAEISRTAAYAKERLNFLRDTLVNNPDNTKAMVKVRVPLNENEKKKSGSDAEHIWINLHKMARETFYGEIMQFPTFMEGYEEGQKVKIPQKAVSDWILYINDTPVTPDTVYLLIDKLY